VNFNWFCFAPFSLFTVWFVSSGASSPEWVKPTAEGGGLADVCMFFLMVWCMLCSVFCFDHALFLGRFYLHSHIATLIK
jgi:hypothetical protein